MATRKQLGGDRLGSGNKLSIDLHHYERSTHDMGYLWRSTTACGTLVPCIHEVAQPGDTWDFNLGMEILTLPTIGPMFGSQKAAIDVFFAPIRLYQGKLHNNTLGIGLKMADIKLPIMRLQANVTNDATTPDIDNAQINPSCVLAYLGIRGVGMNNTGTPQCWRDFCAVKLLALWDTYKNYYANKQEEIGAVIHTIIPAQNQTVTSVNILTAGGTPPGLGVSQYPVITSPVPHVAFGSLISFQYSGAMPDPAHLQLNHAALGWINFVDAITFGSLDTSTAGIIRGIWNSAKYGVGSILNWDYVSATSLPGGGIRVHTFDLNEIDQMREYLLEQVQNPNAVNIADPDLDPWALLLAPRTPGTVQQYQCTQEGLPVKTYQSDMFNNWLQTEWIDGPDGITEITSIDTSGGSFSIDTFNLSKKVYDMLNRIAVSGGSYDDWQEAVYDQKPFGKAETPVYYGSLIKELVFQEVISNAQATNDDGTQPLGTLAGRGRMSSKHKGGKITIKVQEMGIILGLFSLTPRLDYSQGNKWDVHLKTMDDFHKPALDEIGFQELITEQMAWWDTVATGASSGDIGIFVQKSAGKQPAWLNYMTNVNVVLGNFAIANNSMFMVNTRRYEKNPGLTGGIKDLTTYIDPAKFNHIFAQNSLDSQNYWVQIAVDATVRRKISAKVMPNL